MFIKICGITNKDDAGFAVSCGASALGFIFYPKSPRYIQPHDAAKIIETVPEAVSKVGVFVNSPAEEVNKVAADIGLTHVQLHGDESPAYCDSMDAKVIKAFRMKDTDDLEKIFRYHNPIFLLDTFAEEAYGGTGKTFDWTLALHAARFGNPIILSGGLTPENVSGAIEKVKPFGVDVSSGVESEPGKKDRKKVGLFIERALKTFHKLDAYKS